MAKGKVVAGFLVGAVLFALSGCATMDGAKDAQEAKEPEFVLRVNCGASMPYTDKTDNVWLADQVMAADKEWGALGGETIDRGDLDIADTNSPRIYQTERYGLEGYRFKVQNGKYTVRLHFAETYPDITAQGMRVFSVIINNRGILEEFDTFKAGGGFQKPVVVMIEGVIVNKEEIVIEFMKNIQEPEINGIEILSEQLDEKNTVLLLTDTTRFAITNSVFEGVVLAGAEQWLQI